MSEHWSEVLHPDNTRGRVISGDDWTPILQAIEEADAEGVHFGGLEPVQPVEPDVPVTLRGYESPALDDVRAWFGRYVSTVQDSDLDLLTLWAAHTHLVVETFTSPRLVLDSPVPGSGKTTTLEHLEKLCLSSVQMASLSSPAMLVRLLDAGMRTILIDEADRSLSPDKEGIGDLIAVLNSGYKRGGTRPVLIPSKEGGWAVKEMATYAPVAMAGNSPNLPEDTRSRSIRVLLMPDVDDTVEESDWEWIEEDARQLGKELAAWADSVRDHVRMTRPQLPTGIKGRAKERWAPLMRVAEAAGGRWPAVVERLALEDVEEQQLAKEEGTVTQRPHVVLMQHLAEVWPDEAAFVPTEHIIERLVDAHPDVWGQFSSFGKTLTAQRFGRMLSQNYKIHSARPDARASRGYTLASLSTAFRRFGLRVGSTGPMNGEPSIDRVLPETGSSTTPGNQPAQVAEPAEPAQTCVACRSPLDLAARTVGAETCTTCEMERYSK